jgi:hypothetical protein
MSPDLRPKALEQPHDIWIDEGNLKRLQAVAPPLPTPYTAARIAGEDRDLFTAEQMRAYAVADNKALRERCAQLEREKERYSRQCRYLSEKVANAREALRRIAEGCSFPEDDVQRAIRDVARAALVQAEAK